MHARCSCAGLQVRHQSVQHGHPVTGQAQAGLAWHIMLTASALAKPPTASRQNEVTMAKAAAMLLCKTVPVLLCPPPNWQRTEAFIKFWRNAFTREPPCCSCLIVLRQTLWGGWAATYVYCSRSSPAWQTQEIPQTSFAGGLTGATSAQHPVAQRTAYLQHTLQSGSDQRRLAKIICQDVSQLLAMGFPMLAMPCQWYHSQDLGDGPHSTPPLLSSAHVEVRLCSKVRKVAARL